MDSWLLEFMRESSRQVSGQHGIKPCVLPSPTVECYKANECEDQGAPLANRMGYPSEVSPACNHRVHRQHDENDSNPGGHSENAAEFARRESQMVIARLLSAEPEAGNRIGNTKRRQGSTDRAILPGFDCEDCQNAGVALPAEPAQDGKRDVENRLGFELPA